MKNKSNLLFAALILFFLYKQAPVVFNNFKSEGLKITPVSAPLISESSLASAIDFPPQDTNVLAIFWASWCAPCKVEMKRLQNSIENKKISPDKIFAINPFEDRATIKRFIAKNNYDFVFIEAPRISHELKISATPTTVFFEKGVVSRVSSGMSLLGIWWAQSFLK